jgi:hypothetical protein
VDVNSTFTKLLYEKQEATASAEFEQPISFRRQEESHTKSLVKRVGGKTRRLHGFSISAHHSI